MFSFARKLCAETVNNCLPFLKKQDNPYVKQDDKNNDDEEGKITRNTTIDQDDSLEGQNDDEEFTVSWTAMQQETLQDNVDNHYKQENKEEEEEQKVQIQEKKQKEEVIKKQIKPKIGTFDEDSQITKQKELLDQDPDFFDTENAGNEIAFNQSIHGKQETTKIGRFQENTEIEDFNHNGWADDIEIEL